MSSIWFVLVIEFVEVDIDDDDDDDEDEETDGNVAYWLDFDY